MSRVITDDGHRPDHDDGAARHRYSVSAGLPGLPGLLGMADLQVTPERVRARLTVRDEHLAATGYLHAATLVALADTACGYGCLAALPPGRDGFTTVELKSNHLATAGVGATLTVTATPAHLGRTTHVWDAVVTDDRVTPRTLALFRCTQLLLERRTGSGAPPGPG